MKTVRKILSILLIAALAVACVPSKVEPPSPEARLKVGISRQSAIQELADALKHYECFSQSQSVDDLFLYGSSDLEDAYVVYVQSKVISGEMKVDHFGVLENYLIPAEYGYCLGLKAEPSQK